MDQFTGTRSAESNQTFGSQLQRTKPPQEDWYRRSWVVVVVLIVFFPVGLVLMWMSGWKMPTKVVVSTVFVALVIVSVATSKPSTKTTQAVAATSNAQAPTTTRPKPVTTTTKSPPSTTIPPTTVPPTTGPPATSPPTTPPPPPLVADLTGMGATVARMKAAHGADSGPGDVCSAANSCFGSGLTNDESGQTYQFSDVSIAGGARHGLPAELPRQHECRNSGERSHAMDAE